MADLSKVVEIVFRGINEVDPAANAAFKSIKDAGKDIESIASPIADATKAILGLELAAATAGLALGVMAARAAIDFDTNFRLITTLIEEPADSLGTFRDQILDYAGKSTQSIGSINLALQDAIGAGIAYKDSLALLEIAEKGAVANKADLKDSISLLVSTMNAYGDGIDGATRISDVFFRTVADGKVSISELASGISDIAPLAATAGVPIETIGAAIATLTQVGYPAGEAITGLRGAIEAIVNPTDQAKKLANELGIAWNAEALKRNGLQGVLQEMNTATGGNVEQVGTLIGTIEGLGTALTLTGPQSQTFKDELKKMQDSAGATDEAFNKMKDGVGLSLQGMKNAFDLLLINIGTPLLDEVSNLAGGIGNIFNVIADSVKNGPLKLLVSDVEDRFQEVNRIIADIARALPAALEKADFSGFTRGLDVLFGGLDGVSITVDDVRLAVDRVVDAFETMARFTSGVGSVFAPMFGILGTAIDYFNNLDDDTKEWIGVVGGLSLVVGPAAVAIAALAAPLSIIKGLGGVAGAIGDSLAMTTLGSALGQLAGVAGVGLLSYELAKFFDVAGALDDLLFDGKNTLGGWIYDLIHGTEDLATSRGDLRTVLDDENDAWDALIKKGEDALEVNKDNVETDEDRKEIADKLSKSFRDQGYAYDATTGALVKLRDAIKDQADAAKDAEDKARGWRLEIIDGVKVYSQVGPAFQKGDKAVKNTAKEMEDAAKRAHELQLKLLELATDERIALIEAKVQLNVAELEAQTEQIKSAFASIDNTVSSTGDLLGTLFGQINQAGGYANLLIEDQIRKENERRQEALDLQRDLTEAQIDNLRERTRQLAKGDALIKVTADGLEPALELVLWEIIKKVQIRANSDGQEFLLGLPA